MAALSLPPEDTSHGRATLGGDGNSNLFSPLTLINLAVRLSTVSPTQPILPSSLSRVSDRSRGQGLSLNELHRAYCGDNSHQQLTKEGRTWVGLETPNTISAVNDDIEGGTAMMGPPNESMFPTFSPKSVTAEKKEEKEKQYQVSPKYKFELQEKSGLLSGMQPSASRNNLCGDPPKKRIKPMSVKPLTTAGTGSTVVPSTLPVATTLGMPMRRKQNASQRRRRAWPKQIWEYPKWPLLPLDTIDMETKRISELRRRKSPNLNSQHLPRGLATGNGKLSLLFLPADESSMQVTREVGITSRLELHIPWRKRLRQVIALIREKWMAVPHQRLDRLHLLVPRLSPEKDRQVVVGESVQEQPRFLSYWGESKLEWTISDLLDELAPLDTAAGLVPDGNRCIEGFTHFIVLYVLGTVGVDEMGVIEDEAKVAIQAPFPTERRMLSSQYPRTIPSSNPYNLKTMVMTNKTLDTTAGAQQDLERQQPLPLASVNTDLCAGTSSSLFLNEPSIPVCETAKQKRTTTNKASFALGDDTCASLFSWNVE